MSADALPLRGEQGRRILQLYQLYRLVISSALVLLVFSDMDDELLQLANPELFRNGSWLYLALNCLTLVLVRRPTHLAQVFGLALVDVTLLSALFYAGGGTPSGIGNLLIVAVAIANILLRGRIGLLIAALAAIGMIFLTFYLSLSRPAASAQYVQVGALGALCFAAALFVQGLTRRLQASESLAEQRAADVANLEALNALILQRMRTGILVLDEERRVQLANHSAQTLLAQSHLQGHLIDDYSKALVDRLQLWLNNPTLRPQSLKIPGNGLELQPSFIALEQSPNQQTLVLREG